LGESAVLVFQAGCENVLSYGRSDGVYASDSVKGGSKCSDGSSAQSRRCQNKAHVNIQAVRRDDHLELSFVHHVASKERLARVTVGYILGPDLQSGANNVYENGKKRNINIFLLLLLFLQ